MDLHKIYFDTYMLLHPEVKRLHPMQDRSFTSAPAGPNRRCCSGRFAEFGLLKLAGFVEFGYHWKPYKGWQQNERTNPIIMIQEYGNENS
jgi:hypothetical protein